MALGVSGTGIFAVLHNNDTGFWRVIYKPGLRNSKPKTKPLITNTVVGKFQAGKRLPTRFDAGLVNDQ
jgi:hypothetical protein